jgi:hypothetical protein
MTKEKLIDKIKAITDQVVLDDIHRLLEMASDEESYTTSEEEKSRIAAAKAEINSGKIIDSKTADEEIDEWLNG